MITHCPACRRFTESDTMPAQDHPNPNTGERIPARVFCRPCGTFIGFWPDVIGGEVA